ncbi:MAG: hypothetical protein ACJAZN_001056 [Planctomycetota bacterium]|jgi:hypothetical protein
MGSNCDECLGFVTHPDKVTRHRDPKRAHDTVRKCPYSRVDEFAPSTDFPEVVPLDVESRLSTSRRATRRPEKPSAGHDFLNRRTLAKL